MSKGSVKLFTLFNELGELDQTLPFVTLSIFYFLCKWKKQLH